MSATFRLPNLYPVTDFNLIVRIVEGVGDFASRTGPEHVVALAKVSRSSYSSRTLGRQLQCLFKTDEAKFWLSDLDRYRLPQLIFEFSHAPENNEWWKMAHFSDTMHAWVDLGWARAVCRFSKIMSLWALLASFGRIAPASSSPRMSCLHTPSLTDRQFIFANT